MLSKRQKHISEIANTSYNKFISILSPHKKVLHQDLICGWKKLISDDQLIIKVSKYVKNPDAVLGFSSKFPKDTKAKSTKKIVSIVHQSLSEFELIIKILNEYDVDTKNQNIIIEKISNHPTELRCDFRITPNNVYAEAKYIETPTIEAIKTVVQYDAIEQIKSTDPEVKKSGAIIWFFSFKKPVEKDFQDKIEQIRFEANFPITLNILIYNTTIYGFGDIVYPVTFKKSP